MHHQILMNIINVRQLDPIEKPRSLLQEVQCIKNNYLVGQYTQLEVEQT